MYKTAINKLIYLMLVYIYLNSKSSRIYFKCISCVVYLVVWLKQLIASINKRFN